MGCRSDGCSGKCKISTGVQRFSLSLYMVAHCFLLQFFSGRTHLGTVQGGHVQQQFRKDCILKPKCKKPVLES